MPRKIHVVAAAAIWLGCCACLVVETFLTVQFMRRSGAPGWVASWRGDRIEVLVLRPGSPAAGVLLPGDEVVALNGRGVTYGFEPRGAFTGHPPGEEYRLTIRRNGRLVDLRLRTEGWGLSFASFYLTAFIPLGLLFLGTGGAVLLLKPGDKNALLLALTFTLFGATLDPSLAVVPYPTWALVLAAVCQWLAGTFFWPLFLHLFLVFPEPSPVLRRFPWLERAIYLPCFGWALLYLVGLGLFFSDRAAGLFFLVASPIQRAAGTVQVAYIVLGLLSLVLNYRAAGAASRRKLRVVVAGALGAVLPILLVVLLSTVVHVTRLGLWATRILATSLLVSVSLLPLAFAYAIVRHQVIPVRLILRRGMRYLLVSRGFYLVEALLVAGAVAFAVTGSRGAWVDRIGHRADLLAALVVGSGVFGLLQLVNRRVTPVIERRFFREGYDAQRILAEIGEAARVSGPIEDLLSLAAVRIDEALHPESVAIFLRDEATGRYPCVFPPGEGAALLAADAPILANLRRSARPRESEMGGLALPIVAKGDLLGVLSIGPRLAELPYSGADRRWLAAVAWQMAFAIENTQLIRRKVEQERLRREISLAWEVQRRLLPERAPETSRLDLAGLCLPAQGVGGDYYDFLSLGHGRTGIAVADVAGKGISAALLMSVVQASLRSQAGNVVPAQVVTSMNRLLYRSAARNRFATFFYAQFDERSGRLTYVNAGHNPPLLLRSVDGGRAGGATLRAVAGGDGAVAVAAEPEATACVRLSTGGLVIGVLPDVHYEQATLDLTPGDVLVAYTDGVTEAFDPDGQEFGEERLREVAAREAHRPASAMADAVVQAVRGFARGAPPHDDITVVVAKVVA